MKATAKILTLVAVLLGGNACTDQLNLSPVSQISNASFWKSEDDANGALYGMYVRLRGEMASKYFIWGEARSEAMEPSSGGSAGNEVFYNNVLTRTNSGPTWQGLYTIVHDANLILKYAPGITFKSEAAKNNILAQAHTMRAFVYFIMVRTWGKLPLVTEPTEGYDAESIQKERAPVSEIFNLIKSDISKAEGLFPNSQFSTGRFLWSRPALLALKADVHLWTGKRLQGGQSDFSIALAALEEVEKSDVALLENYSRIFDYDNKGNKEIIMAVRFEDIEAGDNEYQNMYSYPGLTPGNLDQPTKDALGLLGGYSIWSPSATLRGQFTNDDQRKDASFIEMFTIENGVRSYYSSVVSKFSGTIINGVRRFLDDVVVYRYADVLLMKAEAKNALGQDPSAEINKVRARAYGTAFAAHEFLNGTVEANDSAILKERLLELSFEGKRWWDVVRFDKAFELVPSLRNRAGQTDLLLFPISETTLSLEPKVEQNPGYN
jgi:hypothetical protein